MRAYMRAYTDALHRRAYRVGYREVHIEDDIEGDIALTYEGHIEKVHMRGIYIEEGIYRGHYIGLIYRGTYIPRTYTYIEEHA